MACKKGNANIGNKGGGKKIQQIKATEKVIKKAK